MVEEKQPDDKEHDHHRQSDQVIKIGRTHRLTVIFACQQPLNHHLVAAHADQRRQHGADRQQIKIIAVLKIEPVEFGLRHRFEKPVVPVGKGEHPCDIEAGHLKQPEQNCRDAADDDHRLDHIGQNHRAHAAHAGINHGNRADDQHRSLRRPAEHGLENNRCRVENAGGVKKPDHQKDSRRRHPAFAVETPFQIFIGGECRRIEKKPQEKSDRQRQKNNIADAAEHHHQPEAVRFARRRNETDRAEQCCENRQRHHQIMHGVAGEQIFFGILFAGKAAPDAEAQQNHTVKHDDQIIKRAQRRNRSGGIHCSTSIFDSNVIMPPMWA
ncbi:hypothetical protein SDC9_105699 [bioreactor metagenome]|uniref:Uncharacterized protein n=1 Tax=bioreactor metagenome TaxID=1076179 RepID=A0A645B1C8_9ZZZZ